jgi:uncharacterized protein involved in outer membrane biogenesis
MKRKTPWWKKLLIGLAIIIAVLLLAVGGFLLYINTDSGKAWLSARASQALNREVEFRGDFTLTHVWPPRIHTSDFTIGNWQESKSNKPMIDAGEITVRVAVLPLLRGELLLPELTVDNTNIVLEKNAKGHANWQFDDSEKTSAPADEKQSSASLPQIGELLVRNSTLSFRDATSDTNIALKVETQGERLRVFGDGTYKGEAFEIDAKGGALDALQGENAYPLRSQITAGNTRIEIKGTLKDPLTFGGPDFQLRLRGNNAADLFSLTGIALPPTPPYDLHGRLTHENGKWKFQRFSGKMGDSDLSGDAIWDTTPERPKLTATLVSNLLDLEDLSGFIGATPEATTPEGAKASGKGASGKGAASGAASQAEKVPENAATVIPDVPLDISRLAAMDAEVDFTGKRILSDGLPLDDFAMKLSLDNRLLRIHPVRFGTANGDISADITVNARSDIPKHRMKVDIRRLSLARLLEPVGDAIGSEQVADGEIGGKATLTGTGKSLHEMLSTSNGVLGIGMEGGQLSNLLIELIGLDVAESLGFLLTGDKVVPVQCLIADFTVNNGVASVRAFIIDTPDTLVEGTGTLNFKGEALKLRLIPSPKDVSLLSLKSPIRVEGTLKKPDVVIEKGGLAARGGAAAALSFVLTPVAGLLAFIEPGLGKDSNCAGLLQQMEQHTGKAAIPRNATPAPVSKAR